MALSESVYARLLEQKIRALKFRGRAVGGYYLAELCDAIGYGVVTETKALTGIIGSPSNTPSSSGVGILTISATNIADIIYTTCGMLWGTKGPLLYPICLAIGETTVEHFALANLSSDTNGTAHFPSFGGAISPMAGLIEGHPRWAGRPYWIKMCTAIATGVCSEVAANGTGTLTGATLPPPGGGIVAIN